MIQKPLEFPEKVKEILSSLLWNSKIFDAEAQFILANSYGFEDNIILTDEEIACELQISVSSLIQKRKRLLIRFKNLLLERNCINTINYYYGLSKATKRKILIKEMECWKNPINFQKTALIHKKVEYKNMKTEEKVRIFYQKMEDVISIQEMAFELQLFLDTTSIEARYFLENLKVKVTQKQYELFLLYMKNLYMENQFLTRVEIPFNDEIDLLLATRELSTSHNRKVK